MKKVSSYSRKERKIINLGYLWRWGSIAAILLIPLITFGICDLLNIALDTKISTTFLSIGITAICVGTYDIIGTVLGFRHLLVSLQLMTPIHFQDLNPRRDWIEKEKKEYLGIGIVLVILGLGFTILFIFNRLGILKL